MKKIIFMFAFVLTASICFANKSIEKTNFIELNKTVNADNSLIYSVSVSVEKEELFGRWMRRRICSYRGGELIGCTAWEYYYELDEIVITAN